MKKNMSKYMVYIIIGVLLILFVVLSLLMNDGDVKNREMGSEVSLWLEDTKKDQYVVTVFAQTFCGYCKQYQPVVQKIYNENDDMIVYWFDIDEKSSLNAEERETVTSTYETPDFTGTPYTLITKNGQTVAHYDRGADRETILKFFKENNVIK